MATPEEYFVGIYVERHVFVKIKKSETLKLTPEQEGRLKEIDAEVRELARKMGGSMRRKVNAMLQPLGYPKLKKGGLGPRQSTPWEF